MVGNGKIADCSFSCDVDFANFEWTLKLKNSNQRRCVLSPVKALGLCIALLVVSPVCCPDQYLRLPCIAHCLPWLMAEADAPQMQMYPNRKEAAADNGQGWITLSKRPG